MSDPYRIEGPALISFSGGRTSAYMLHEIVKAHGGSLPDNIIVAFANTGKEREETLRFVHECGSRWGVRIRWVEWRDTGAGFEEVGFNSASRQGEPFEALIRKKGGRLPNWKERWCTGYLKVQTMFALMRSLGYADGTYLEAIGLRDDERYRIETGLESAAKRGRRICYPLATAGVTKPDVLAFWRSQPFDLGLEGHQGNCDLCFLKGRGLKKAIIRETPGVADWWMAREADDQWFDRRDSVIGLRDEALNDLFAPSLLPVDFEESECGPVCGADLIFPVEAA